MRWLPFILMAGAVLTLQATVAPRFELHEVRPDWLLVLVVVIALHAGMADAALGAWIVGACADLMTIERPGLVSLSYLAAALVVTSAREFLFRHRWLTQFAVTLVMCFLVRTGWLVYRRMLYSSFESPWVDAWTDVVLCSVYTAAWAPLLNWAVKPMARVLGLERPRHSYVGLDRLGESRV